MARPPDRCERFEGNRLPCRREPTYHHGVGLNRRELLTGAGGAAAGALGLFAADRAAAAPESAHLPFYGGYASAVRPDLSAPHAPSGAVVWSGQTATRRVALTFDDGPMPDWTPRVLEALARHDVPATFFVKGVNVRRHAAIHRDSVGRHEIGNHTWDHPDLARLDHPACTDQLERTTAEIEHAYGVRPTLFRPPYGHLGGSSLLAAAEQGLTTVLWSAQMRENLYVQHPEGITGYLRSTVRPGSVILAHDTGPADRLVTIVHLDAIITGLKADGYELTTVSALCGLPGSDAHA